MVESLKNYKTSGTIVPCSKYAAQFALKNVDLKNAKTIVELGCGTGVFTKVIEKKKNQRTRFIAIEINEELAKEAQKNNPNTKIVQDSAENLSQILKENENEKADIIISTLPWAIFEKELQIKILNEVYSNLEENGEFITISYIITNRLKKGKSFYTLLKSKFNKVKKTRFVVKNLPPSFFYYCKKLPINL